MRGRRSGACSCALVVALVCHLARSHHGAATELPEELTVKSARRTEKSIVPVFSADTDRGFGFGAFAVLAHFRQGYYPYKWRLQLLAYLTVKGDEQGVVAPYHTYGLELDLPQLLLDGKLRVNARLRFKRKMDNAYYGVGNAALDLSSHADEYHQYGRSAAELRLQTRLSLRRQWQLLTEVDLGYDWLTVDEESKLARDREDAALGELLQGTDGGFRTQLSVGLVYDSRDHEFTPTRGMFNDLSLRLAPDVESGSDGGHGGVNLTLRLYHPLLGRRLSVAARLMGDLLFGEPAFYELARHGGLDAGCTIGGDASVRGVPMQRYHGKGKLLGNLELRSWLLPFRLFAQRLVLGAVAFADAGRVWSAYDSGGELDGRGLGLKFGAGGGLRLKWGETVVIRFDTAWSPDADPVGLYFNINNTF